MALMVSDTAEQHLLNVLLNKITNNDLRIHLYESPTSAPTESTTIGGITEATGSGYDGPHDMPNANWTVTTALGVTEAEHDPIVFTYSGAKTVYGYYVTDNTDTYLCWVEQFSGAPFVLPAGGGTITITSKIQLD